MGEEVYRKLREIEDRLAAAAEADEDTDAIGDELIAFMRANGIVNSPGADVFDDLPDPAPLTDDEKATLVEMMVNAKLAGNDADLDRLAALAADPAEYRRIVGTGK